MGRFDGCLLASDVDGTLLTSGVIPTRNLDMIEYFTREGGHFALSTGRTVGAVRPVIRSLKSLGASITGNGSVIYDFSKSEIKHSVLLGEDALRAVLDINTAFPDVGIELHSGEDVFVLARTGETDDHEEYEELTTYPITPDKVLALQCNKVLIALNCEDQREALEGFWGRFSECGDFLHTNAEIYGRMRHYCEVVPRGCNKASALVKLKEILNIKEGRCFAIGDFYNDLEMLKVADISAVTAEAPQDLKNVADTVVGSVREGAVADFIEYIEKLIGQEGSL